LVSPLLALRALEIGALNVRWDRNAYGSIVWALILLHTLHTTTDVFDSGVLSALTFTKKMTGRRFSDVSDNALYWHFVVWSWAVLYVVVLLGRRDGCSAIPEDGVGEPGQDWPGYRRRFGLPATAPARCLHFNCHGGGTSVGVLSGALVLALIAAGAWISWRTRMIFV
jgi:hypothetical protein